MEEIVPLAHSLATRSFRHPHINIEKQRRKHKIISCSKVRTPPNRENMTPHKKFKPCTIRRSGYNHNKNRES